MGFVLADLTTNFERVADHCSNIGVCLLELQDDGMDVHEYLDVLRQSEDENFKNRWYSLQKNMLCRKIDGYRERR